MSLIAHARVVVRHAAGLPSMVRKWFFPLRAYFALLSIQTTSRKKARRVVGIFCSRGNECVIKSSRGHRQDSICGQAPAELQRPAVNKACNARRTRTSLFARVHHPISRSLAAFVSVPRPSLPTYSRLHPMARQ